MERLTQQVDASRVITADGLDVVEALHNKGYSRMAMFLEDVLKKLCEYEDSGLTPAEVASMARLKAAGRLKLLPCAVGDTVYEIRTNYKTGRKRTPYDYSCIGKPNTLKFYPDKCYVASKVCTQTDLLHLGKMVFTTEQEALAVLEEAKKNAIHKKK